MDSRAIVAALLCVAAARGEDRFGARGQVVPFGGIGYSHSAGNGASSDSVSLAPGLLWFVDDGFALGVSTIFGYRSLSQPTPGFPSTTSKTSFGATPMAAVALPLSERVAFFPQAGVSYSWLRDTSSGLALTSHSVIVQGFAPLLFIPAPHFFLGFGPSLSWIVEGADSNTVAVGLVSQIGGYF